MKRIYYILVILWIAALSTMAMAEPSQQRTNILFLQAVEAYKKADYAESIRLNSEALATGFESAALHYNLGNSYLRSRQLGHAIASYLRAERLAPGDIDIIANLNYTRGQVSAPGSAGKQPFWAAPLQRFSPNELRWSALIVFMCTATIVLAGLFAGWKKSRIWWWAVAGGLAFIYCCLGGFSRLAEDSDLGVCLSQVDVKFEPSDQATTYFRLPEGAEIRVLREKDSWFKIERADRKSGWVTSKAVERI